MVSVPELPEVETTRLGISPHLIGETIQEVIIRRRDLRQPVSEGVEELAGASFTGVLRRSKYLLLETNRGQSLLVHLGMSGSLRIVSPADEWKKHDHVAFTLSTGKQLRYHDPRRFGLILLIAIVEATTHPLLKDLGPEPLEDAFTAAYLYQALRRKSIPVKVALMDAKTVVGVGNIYASEALFRSGIHPLLPASKITKPRSEKLVRAIKEVLTESITQGGTTLRDFLQSDGEPGYFKQRLYVYDRKGEPCRICGRAISHCVLGQRSTYFCAKCQKR